MDIALTEFHASDLDLEAAARQYREDGYLVVRGLMAAHVPALRADVERAAAQALRLLDRAVQRPEGWNTPDGSLFIPAPPGFSRDRQIMGLAMNYSTSAAMFRAAFDPALVDVASAIIGPNVELFNNGQCIYKEPFGGHAKHLHQDAAYFDNKFDGPVGALTYLVDTDLVNGALHVVPGSHRFETLPHEDTPSHLGLSAGEWPWERALPVEGKAGDTIFFHVRTIHGSRENRSDKPRAVVINRYRDPNDFITVVGSTVANRAESEKHAAQARKDNQRGWMVRGFRDVE